MHSAATSRGLPVAIARQAKGWTQNQLAEAAGLSQGYVSKVESDRTQLETDGAIAISAALGVPLDLLGVPEQDLGGDLGCIHHRRRRSKIPASAARTVSAVTQLSGLTVSRINALTDLSLPAQIDENSPADPMAAALWLRSAIGNHDEPIQSIISLAESLGVRVLRRSLGTNLQDGVSLARPHDLSLIIVNAGLPGDRERYTVAHELGHLLMHSMKNNLDVDPAVAEIEANRFAGALLFPPSVAENELKGLTARDFKRLFTLKEVWGVSMGALIEQAKLVGAVNETDHRHLRITLSERGWHRSEPGTVVNDKVVAIPSAVDQLLDLKGLSVLEAAATALMRPETFIRIYMQHRAPATDGAK